MTEMTVEPGHLGWSIDRHDDELCVTFAGEIDENADFSKLRRQLKGTVVFHLADIRRINSCGVREWVNFVRTLPDVSSLAFTHCSTVAVTQLNMIYNFRGAAVIRSFYAPYVCEACDAEEDKLLSVDELGYEGTRVTPPTFRCSRCGEPLEFDDIPERYFAFLLQS